ncbi:thyroid adenoma-associated protein [Periophthalmus magnuspinnatus]|uniref:thyroid adenoma-associated protein n=1 Tax=Periophthalmus magnuspinnatus TaxID=409849 RepID=UPI00145B9B17|nr:thyroid adenoma-associated protein [Periophthalmus magnuspinnatus]
MVVKKKTPKVEAVVLDGDKLSKLIASLSIDGGENGVQNLAKTLQSCLELTDPVQQIQLVKTAGAQLEALTEDLPDGPLLGACLHTLALVYTSLQPKNPLRRAIASALGSVPVWLVDRVVVSLSSCLSDCLSNPASDKFNQNVDIIAACLDGFPVGEKCINKLLPEVLEFLHTGLSKCLHQNSDLAGRHIAQAQLMHSCLSAVKASMLVVQRSQDTICALLQREKEKSHFEDTLSSLLDCYTEILTDDEFVQSVQSTAGMAMVLLIKSVMGSGDEVASVVCSFLHGSSEGLDLAPQWLKHRCERVLMSGQPPGVCLYLCHGALAMLSWKGAIPGPQWEQLLLLVPQILLELDVSVKESSTAMVVARVLTLWSGAALDCLQGTQPCPDALQSLRGGSELQQRILEHIYSHWEHPLDGVRHQTRSLFKNLLVLHRLTSPSDSKQDPRTDPYINTLTQSLLGLEWHMRGKYGSLSCLVELHGAGYILEMQPQLPSCLLSLMGDQTLAPYASDLLERLFVSHKTQLSAQAEEGQVENWMHQWHVTWVTPLLQVLCSARLDQTTYILDYFLPKLLRCSPSSVSHMVQALQDMPLCSSGPTGSRGALGALMTCLRAARAQGVVPSSEEGLWGGLLPLSLLRQALAHKHDQVRMDALGLVCESHRSTETLTSQELELIQYFLPPNLNSQNPGVRQQTVSLFKKLLCRVKDSAQFLQKKAGQEKNQEKKDQDQQTLHYYKEFLRWMCVTLLDMLLPGASFSKCIMCLHLLCLMGQIFTFTADPDSFALGEVVTSNHAQNVLYCIASNFLEVKQLASTLLRQLLPSTVGLKAADRMANVLQAALDLSTSTKPFDSVTAAHLLNLLIHEPDLTQALRLCAQRQGLEVQPPVPPAEASQTLILEINTLAVIQFLLHCLQSEVIKAESSLLQAAASFPLYGRCHCITAVLQQLNTGNLSEAEQWWALVSELITVCYRTSDVVAPVVQSSSPEGLIPMDNDSETSSGLQKILQEIQPRDTNDFFTNARELEPEQTEEEAKNSHHPSLNTGGESYRVTAQMVLVCCWRSMKEVSMLLGQLCQSLPLDFTNEDGERHQGLITEKQVEGVGLYFRQQLLQSRHRGAFELAYVGFVRLTDMLCRSGSQALQRLPSRWLSEVLEEVKSSDPSSKLCATRRSAGIPFYIQALLSSEPKSSSCSLLKMTMRELIALATPSSDRDTERSTVPQVHALNILRALYRDTRLGENIIPFVSEGMQAAVLGFTSAVWAVRNSSTLLFSTLITRIFGVKKGKDEHSKKNRMTGREFFTRFPALYPFLLTQLEEAAATVESDSGQVKLHPSLFLLLLVLSRLYPSPMDGSSSPLGLAPFTPFIIRCGHSAVYRTREMAARAIVPFVLVTQVPSTVCDLLKELPLSPGPKIQHNHIHGTLLQVLFLLRSFQSDSHRPLPPENGIGSALRQRMWIASCQNSCLVTRGAFLDVLACLCGPKISLLEDCEVRELRQEVLSILLASDLFVPGPSSVVPAPGSTQYLLSLSRVALNATVEHPELWDTQQAPQLLQHLLSSISYEVRALTLDTLLKQLQQRSMDRDRDSDRGPEWQNQTTLSHLTSRAFHETHPHCLSKVLEVLCALCSSEPILWWDRGRLMSQEEVHRRLLFLAQTSAHSVELHCAALTLFSQLVAQRVTSDPQDGSAASCFSEWAALVCSCCSEEHPVEVKMMVSKVLVQCTAPVLTSPSLPLGLDTTVSLWRSLVTLLQDEDQEVRDAAADFICFVPADLLCPDVSGSSVCPPLALDSAVGVLCRLLKQWERVPEGVLSLTEWLLGNEDVNQEEAESGDETSLDDEDFLFEKGALNLWAEPVQWVRLLHRHLSSLVQTLVQTLDPGSGLHLSRIRTLSDQAQTQSQSALKSLSSLPSLPQFICPMEHARLTLKHDRAQLALDVLHKLR